MSDLVQKSPCVFCGYNGAGYFQRGTHAPGCPWYSVGGCDEREKLLPDVLRQLVRERDDARAKLASLEEDYRKMALQSINAAMERE